MSQLRTFGFVALLVAVAVPATLTPGCQADEGPDDGPMAKSSKQRVLNPQVAAQDLAAQVQANTSFAVDLYHQVRQSGSNLFIAPHSISTALAMLFGGARNTTEQEMAKALHFDLAQEKLHPAFNQLDLALASRGKGAKGSDGGAFELSVANALWGRPDGHYEADYLDLLALNYGAGMHLVDFGGNPEGARQQINDWVAGKTRNRIPELLQKGVIDAKTALVLTNAIYFNAAWDEPFTEAATAPHAFDADGGQVTVQMMSGTKKHARYAKGAGYQAVELDFDGRELSMLLLVPDAGTFRSFQQGLTQKTLADAISSLTSTTVALDLPRFSFSSRRELKEPLRALGMKQAFEACCSDFFGICGAAPGTDAALMVTEVIHQAFVLVAEKGAEAAGATAVVMADAGMAMPSEPIYLTVDRPFLFLIRDNATGAVLFLGHVIDPTASK